MKYQKYPAQTIKVAGDLRRAPATFENPEKYVNQSCFAADTQFMFYNLPVLVMFALGSNV